MAICFSDLGNYGRKGNSLFQAAATIALALRNNDIYLFPEQSGLQHKTKILPSAFTNNIHKFYNKTYNEPLFTYSPIPYQNNLNIKGYFQSEKYFIDFKDKIISLLTPPIDVGKYTGYTSIHVRRGDYLIHKDCYVILDRNNYYDKAIEASGGKKFLIFSDDIAWCKNHFKGNNFEFSDGNSEDIDFCMMMSCDNNIIANSSFSWWASYLNQSQTKKIIAPGLWFGPKLYKDNPTTDLIPGGWVII